jgi:hypothetical protein
MSDDFFDIGWEEMALAGSLAEEMRERRRLEQEKEQEEDCPCCSKDCDDFDPPDEDFCP